jgi:HK97 family phage portal protein
MPPLSGDEAWQAYLRGKGHYVSATTALQVSAVIRCVDVVAKTMASLPLHLYRKTATGREKADDHRLYKLLHSLPNPETTAYEFWHMYVFNLMLTSGGYAKIKRDRNGFITELWNIPTANVALHRNRINGERYIDVYNEIELQGKLGLVDRLREGEFMFTPGLRFSSITNPENPVRIAKEVLGLTMALNAYAKDFFENGANVGGVVELQGKMSEPAYQQFKQSWHEAYAGIKNQHKTAILEEGGKFNELGKNPNDSQALESRKFQIAEACRIFGVRP